jgi:hypothetical protein
MRSKPHRSKPPQPDPAQDSGHADWASTGAVLPPRRSITDAAESDRESQIGLRIEPNITRGSDKDPVMKLEIQEINGSSTRLEEAAPAPEKVPRVVVFREKGERVKGLGRDKPADADWGESKKQPLRWMFYAGGGVVALVILITALLLLLQNINKPTPNLTEIRLEVETEAKEDEFEVANSFMEKGKEAAELLDRYLRASSVDEVIPLILDGESNREVVQKNWKPLKNVQSWKLETKESWTVFGQDGETYGSLSTTLPDYSNYTAYFAKAGSRMLLDWKASSQYCSASFEELATGKGDSSEIRGIFSTENYYTLAWPESVYASCKLISPDNSHSIWCYIRRDDEALMRKLFPNEFQLIEFPKNSAVTVRLERGPTEAAPNQWQIVELLDENWIQSKQNP